MVSNPKNREAFNELLKVEYAISQGKEMEIKTFTELTNFTAELNMSKVRMLIDNKKYQEADELLELLLSKKDDISTKLFTETISLKIYVLKFLVSEEEFKKYIEKNIDLDLRKVIGENKKLSSIRAYLLIEGFYDNSKNECLYALAKVERAYKRVEKQRRNVELAQFNEVIDMIDKAHPKWGIGQYKLVETSKKEEK
jgi:integrase